MAVQSRRAASAAPQSSHTKPSIGRLHVEDSPEQGGRFRRMYGRPSPATAPRRSFRLTAILPDVGGLFEKWSILPRARGRRRAARINVPPSRRDRGKSPAAAVTITGRPAAHRLVHHDNPSSCRDGRRTRPPRGSAGGRPVQRGGKMNEMAAEGGYGTPRGTGAGVRRPGASRPCRIAKQ